MKYEIFPQNIIKNVGDQIQLTVIKTDENGEQDTAGNVIWEEIGGGGHIDTYGVLYAINAGVFKIKATVRDTGKGEEYEEEKTEIEYTIQDAKQVKTWAEKIREARLKAVTSVSKVYIPVETEKQEKPRKAGFMSTTRAIARTAIVNCDLICLFFLILFCVSLGCCTVLLLSGITVEKIIFFLSSFFATIISFFGKIYSAPGEISQEIHEKMLGATPEEKVKNLEKQKEHIETKIRGYTTKQRPVSQGFFKFSIDERTQPEKE